MKKILMLRQELQSYFDRVYPSSKIDATCTISGQIEIRFELGGEYENGTIERVNQATDRAVILFDDTFDNQKNEIWVLIYEYLEPNFFNAPNDYLHRQFPTELFGRFYNQLEHVDTCDVTVDENGSEVLERNEVKVIIGKVALKAINIRNILTGIANTEMGFKPGINQRIFFFDPFTDKAFHMDDDRGCYVWSDKADKIRDIYVRRNGWIVDDHRQEIDQQFK